MKNIIINIDGMSFWTLVSIHSALSEVAHNDEAMDVINDHIAENKVNFMRAAVSEGDTEAISLISELFGPSFHEWLCDASHDTPENWSIVEMAASEFSANGLSGKFVGLCSALEAMSGCGDVRDFISDYAHDNYENGVRVG